MAGRLGAFRWLARLGLGLLLGLIWVLLAPGSAAQARPPLLLSAELTLVAPAQLALPSCAV